MAEKVSVSNNTMLCKILFPFVSFLWVPFYLYFIQFMLRNDRNSLYSTFIFNHKNLPMSFTLSHKISERYHSNETFLFLGFQLANYQLRLLA